MDSWHTCTSGIEVPPPPINSRGLYIYAMHLKRILSLSVVVSSAASCFASHPAEALTVPATVNGVTYDVTTFTGTYDANTSKFALPPSGLMPWWGSKSIASDFATQVWDRLGLPYYNFAGPIFAYQTASDPEFPELTSIEGRVLDSSIPGIDQFGGNSNDSLTFAIIVPAAAPAVVPGPLPLFGAAAAFGLSRRLRRRIQLGG